MKFCPICPDITLEVKHNFLGTFEECPRCNYSKQISLPKEKAVSDPVNHPIHYKSDISGIECIEAIKAQLGKEGFIAFLRGQVAKYNWRLGKKDAAKIDAEKAQWYMNRLVKELDENTP